tara:strand:- start:379 stop:561 length:183 start_codon:yes stop_codon:yes gene_type:complete
LRTGDLVRTKVPGFGTGKESKVGTIIRETYFVDTKKPAIVEVLHEDGTFYEWYTWQLEKV